MSVRSRISSSPVSLASLFQLLFQAAAKIKRVSVLTNRSILNKLTSKPLRWPRSPFQVGVHVIESMVLRQVHQHSRGTAAVSGPTEAAVADPSARRTQPLLPETHSPSDPHDALTGACERDRARLGNSPDPAARRGPPPRSGYEDRGRRTDP